MTAFESYYELFAEDQRKGEEQSSLFCPYSRQFQAWVDELLQNLSTPSVVQINQAKVLLVDKYFEWKRIVPRTTRNHLGVSGKHYCITNVFEDTYIAKLKAAEIALTPPMLFLPPPPQPPRPEYPALAFGEEEDESPS